MVSLSVSRRGPNSLEEAEAIYQRRHSLAHSSLWYPEMPALDVHMNQDSAALTGEIHSQWKDEINPHYYPLWYTKFGGDEGDLLPRLLSVSGNIDGTLTFAYETCDSSSPSSSLPGIPSRAFGSGRNLGRRPNVRAGRRGRGHVDEVERSLNVVGKDGERIVGATMVFNCSSLGSEEDPRVWGELTSIVVRTCAFFSFSPLPL